MFQSWIGIFATYSYMDDQSFIVIELFLVRKGGTKRGGGSTVFCIHQTMQAHFQVTETDCKGISASPVQSSKLNLAMAFCETSFIPAT